MGRLRQGRPIGSVRTVVWEGLVFPRKDQAERSRGVTLVVSTAMTTGRTMHEAAAAPHAPPF